MKDKFLILNKSMALKILLTLNLHYKGLNKNLIIIQDLDIIIKQKKVKVNKDINNNRTLLY